jgi:hypothetical protein
MLKTVYITAQVSVLKAKVNSMSLEYGADLSTEKIDLRFRCIYYLIFGRLLYQHCCHWLPIDKM